VTAVIGDDGQPVRYEVDATAGDEALRDGVLTFIDLDIDMEIEDGVVEVTDLVEFAERREQMGYPPGLLSAVVLALDRALDRERRGDWPFDGSLR
jgi:protein associated with RNAse G/E